jgi:hypothetical protein
MYDEVKLYHLNPNRLWRVWERVPHLTLENLLTARDCLIILGHGSPPYNVVLGVPHHSANGVWQICEQRRDKLGNLKPRKGDDNAALFALVAFSMLKEHNTPCKLVIMAHATTHDPNKVMFSPYCQEILREKTRLIFECHAANAKRVLDLELSSGSNELSQTYDFGRNLAVALGYRYSLGVQTNHGQSTALIYQPGGKTVWGKLQLPAIKTVSLIEASHRGIPALHLEAKPNFRVSANMANSVSSDGLFLGRAIAETIVAQTNIMLIS